MVGKGRSGPDLWRSLEERGPAAVEAMLEAEFPALHALGSVSRRDLMRLMGASLALAGVAGCEVPSGRPLLSQPTDSPLHVPGRPLYFATALELDGYGRGVVVESHDGRPIKIDGNPLHPASLGATDPIMQGELLSLYDPDRSGAPWAEGRERSWAEFRRFLAAARGRLVESRGAGYHILLGATSSPTAARLIARIRLLYPGLRFHSYSPVNDPAGASPGFEGSVEQVFRFDRATAVLSLGADFMGPGPAQVRHARDWAGRRRDLEQAGAYHRLWVAEASPTLTGAQADRRLPLRPDRIEHLARGVATALGVEGAGATPDRIAQEIAAALARSGTGALVVAGLDQPGSVQSLAFRINQRLGAIGNTVEVIAPVRLGAAEGIEPLSDLVVEMATGRVRGLVAADCNPAYDAPADPLWDDLLPRVPLSLHLGLHRDETARLSDWHVPQRHVLERWGDIRAVDGTAAIQQPATIPLRSAMSAIQLLGLLAGERPDEARLVRATWPGFSDAEWLRVLEAGVVPDSAAEPAVAVPLPIPPSPPPALARGIALTFRPDSRLWDGRYANNAWLQELPDPITKLVWGNAALISPATAEAMGLANGDLVALGTAAGEVETPVWIAPGQAAGVVTMMLGYGRPFAGRVGGGIGVDAYRLRRRGETRGTIRKTGGKGRLISTEWHQPMERSEAVQVVAPGQPLLPEPRANRPSLYPEYAALEQAWGMVIDLDACIGCGTCTIACQAENNIPVVGPDEVERGREMHWIRVDRYYAGSPAAPDMHFQPVPCMHCEKAPCELVCPVGATVHSSDGLNQMVYNRCIGTRTCSNNCPYKVRRFNWFDYTDREPDVPPAVHNPRVLVRDRGVMEKCTYCVQRIRDAEADAAVEGRPLRRDEVATACEQACPTKAIVFGDLNDPASAVALLRGSSRNYALLGKLNTQPRTTYLARVRQEQEGQG